MIKNYALLYIFFATISMHAMEITRASETVGKRHPAEEPPSDGKCYLLDLPSEMRSSIAEYVRGGELEEKVKIKAYMESLLWFLADDLMKTEHSKIYRSHSTDGWIGNIRVWRYDSAGDPHAAPYTSGHSSDLYTMEATVICPSLLGVKDTHYLVLNALHDRQCEQRVFSSLHRSRLVRQSQADGLIKLADMPNPGCLYTIELVRDTRWLVTRVCNEAGVWVEKRRRELPVESKYSSMLVGTELEGVGLLREGEQVDIIKNINYKKDHLFYLFASMGVFKGLEKLKN